MKKSPKIISLAYLENLVREQELKEKKIFKIITSDYNSNNDGF
jgi:hypothetical protein